MKKTPISYDLQHREEALLRLLRRYPNQVIKGLALQQEAGWAFGRFYLVGAITYDQYQAARYLDRVTREYELLVHRYGLLRAGSLDITTNRGIEDLSKSAQKRFAKVQRRYDRTYDLLAQCGNDVKKAIVATLKQDDTANLEEIQRGLSVLTVAVVTIGRAPIKRNRNENKS